MIHPERVQRLNAVAPAGGKYVLYWMQASQRVEDNHSLESAIVKANQLDQPLVVAFGLTDDYPGANLRHYAFMLQGLAETQAALEKRGIKMVVLRDSPDAAAIQMSREASFAVTDRGYTRIQRAWRKAAGEQMKCPLVQVESDVVVPIETVSPKLEFAARTIRPKIHKHLENFLKPIVATKLKSPSLSLKIPSFEIRDVEAALSKLKVDRSVKPVAGFRGGTSEAKKHLKEFITHRLSDYALERNDPTLKKLSEMSPYLHFGQISPLTIALKIRDQDAPGKTAYLEEMIVRRELSMNYAFYNPAYDSYEGLPQWAKETLDKHRKDKREYSYALAEFEQARTHDPYWNAAQQQMVRTGKMHGYMRMYWGKKILEWNEKPEEAYKIAVYLNDKYELDGRDPNGYTGVAWCFGTHDRPWGERPVFGMVRYMNANGLERKFDAKKYVEQQSASGTCSQ